MASASMHTRLRRVWVTTGVLALLLATGVAAWVGVRAVIVMSELKAASALTSDVRAALEGRDAASMRDAVDAVEVHAAAAARASSDPVWRGAELLPYLGPNLAGARVASVQLDAALRDVAGALLDLSEQFSASDEDHRVLDVAMLRTAAEPLRTAAETLHHATTEFAHLDRTDLIPPLASGIDQLDETVGSLAPTVQALADASAIGPALLGADGERRILLMVQNPTELRSGGGIASAFAEVRAVDGHLTLSTQRSSADFDNGRAVDVAIPTELTKMLGGEIGHFVMNSTMTDDFDLTARLSSAWWARAEGAVPDAVVSVDPLVLAALLEVTGPLELDGQELSSANVVTRLLVDPYIELSADQQDDLFQRALAVVFEALTTSDIDPLHLLDALAQPAADGRISLWSAHAAEQDLIVTTPLGGLAVRQQSAPDIFSIAFNDMTGAKMGTFLDVAVSVGSSVCRPDGFADVVVGVTLTSTAPADSAETLPGRMTGEGLAGIAPGDIGTLVTVTGPRGAFVGAVRVDGAPGSPVDTTLAGAVQLTEGVVLGPGQATVIEFHFTVPSELAASPRIVHTPLLIEPEITERKVVCP
ncbi:DUF4012 domain-containing protein [Microbacterium aurum]